MNEGMKIESKEERSGKLMKGLRVQVKEER